MSYISYLLITDLSYYELRRSQIFEVKGLQKNTKFQFQSVDTKK